MSITGHETPAMFRRYAGLISPKEQDALLTARDALLEREAEETGNVEPIAGRS